MADSQKEDTLVAGIRAEDSLAEGSLGVDILEEDSQAADNRNLVRYARCKISGFST